MTNHPNPSGPGAEQSARASGHDDDRAIHQVRSDGRIIGEIRFDTPIFVISVAAELAGMHAQTLRSYDREGLVRPKRTSGGGRRYSQRDIELLQQVQQLSQDEGVNRAGIRRIMELESRVDELRTQIEDLMSELTQVRADIARGSTGSGPGGARSARGAAGADIARGTAGAGRSPTDAAMGRDMVPWTSRTTAIVTWRPRRGR